jgi:hypothetical protein
MKPARMVPLHVAVEKFTSKAALEPPLVLSLEQQVRPDMTPEEAGKVLLSTLPVFAKDIFRPALNWQKRFEYLCRLLERRKLVAYGIRTKPTVGEAPELIPANLFRNPEWDEERDAIENAGHRFELIEVGRPPRDASYEPVEPVRTKKMGRPSKEAEIEEFVRDVLKDSSVSRNRKALCQRVREVAVTQGKSIDDGYSDSTIKRLIVRVLAEKNGSKVQK